MSQQPSRRPLVISHRTNAGAMPENTLAGIDAAIADRADGVEVDVRATRDGRPVLLHDSSLARTTGDPRELSALSARALRSLRVTDPHGRVAPQPVPTLAEALARTVGRCLLVMEIKEAGIESTVGRLVNDAAAADWCWIWAFDPDIGVACRSEMPQVPVALLVAPDSAPRYGYRSHIDVAARAGFAAVSLAHAMVSPAAVEEAHGRGLQVYTWSVDEPADIERVRDAGVDAICGDYPARILARLRRPDRGPDASAGSPPRALGHD